MTKKVIYRTNIHGQLVAGCYNVRDVDISDEILYIYTDKGLLICFNDKTLMYDIYLSKYAIDITAKKISRKFMR